MNGWICVDVGPLERFASVTVRIGERSGRPGERLPASEGPTRVLVIAQTANARGVLRVETSVVQGRVTTLFCLPALPAFDPWRGAFVACPESKEPRSKMLGDSTEEGES
jgi:hypothetical protein